MILWFLSLMVIGLYLSFIMMKRSLPRSILITFLGISVVGSLLLITLNDNAHFGMVKTITINKKAIYTVSPNTRLSMLLKQKIGTASKHVVYIYKIDPKKKATHTIADIAVINQVTTTSKDIASLTSKTTRWQYRNGLYGALFNYEGAGQLVAQHNRLTIPKSWYVFTTAQAKQLGKKLAFLQKPTAQQQVELEAAAKAKAAALIKDDPKLAANPVILAKQAKVAVEQAMIQQAIREVRAQK